MELFLVAICFLIWVCASVFWESRENAEQTAQEKKEMQDYIRRLFKY